MQGTIFKEKTRKTYDKSSQNKKMSIKAILAIRGHLYITQGCFEPPTHLRKDIFTT